MKKLLNLFAGLFAVLGLGACDKTEESGLATPRQEAISSGFPTPVSPEIAGKFKREPRGDWVCVKVFVAGGEGEFFLNLSRKVGDAELSLKDSSYGDIVLAELAKAL